MFLITENQCLSVIILVSQRLAILVYLFHCKCLLISLYQFQKFIIDKADPLISRYIVLVPTLPFFN